MLNIDTSHEHAIHITQESEAVPIVVKQEVGKLMTDQWAEVSPVVGGMGQPEISHKPNVRERFHAAVSPKRPVNMLNDADTVFPMTREHEDLFPSAFIGPKPLSTEEKRIAREGRPARQALRRGAAAVRLSGHHY